MLILLFHFRGTRKVVASRLMESLDFKAELEAFLPILDRHYGHYLVSAVNIVSYQRGDFFYDPWPEGLYLVQAHQAERNFASPIPPTETEPEESEAV